jgi:hypothetical protein
MKRIFCLLPVVVMVLISCNSGDKTTPVPVQDSMPPKDSSVIVKTADNPIPNEPDYVQRKVSITPAEWPAFRVKARLADNPPAVTGKIKGDFNGDGRPETVYLVAPVEDSSKDAFQECYGGCNSYLLSSDAAMPVLIVHDNLGGEIKNIGDMDGDGADDIVVYPAWWQSNWNPYRLYSFKKSTGEWRYLTEPVSIFAPDLYDHKKPLVKKSARPGYVVAFTSETNDDGDTKSSYRELPLIK